MSASLKITLIQTELYWQDRAANLDHFTKCIHAINTPTDLIVLPEMFSTGFSMNPAEHAETAEGDAVNWMKQMAELKSCAITGSIMIQEGGKYYNCLFFVLPNGQLFTYNKKHLFRMAGENEHYQEGHSRLLITYKEFNIFPVICYDLRFPVWLRRTKNHNYDLLLIVANWPERRSLHWKTLIQARAIENQCWVAAVNRVGQDGNQIKHSGDSALINAKGEIIFQQSNKSFIQTFTIHKEESNEYRNSFNVMDDADSFDLSE